MFNWRLFSVFSLGLLLAGCGGRYQVRPLKPVKRERAHFVQTKAGVEVCIRQLKKHEIGEIFNGQTIPEALKISAYAITVDNTTNETIFLSTRQLSLRQLSAHEVFALLRYDHSSTTLKRALIAGVVAGGVATVLFTSMGVLAIVASSGSACGSLLAAENLLPIAGVFAGATAFYAAVTGIPLGISRGVFNDDLRSDIRKKNLTDLTIAPHSQETRLFFARAGQPSFTLAIQGSDKHHILFNIGLNR